MRYVAALMRHRRWFRLSVAPVLIPGVLLAACGSSEQCDPQAAAAFESLPAYDGVQVDLHASSGIGCTDTVRPANPGAFVAHYENAMRQAGWKLITDERGVFGKGPKGGVRVDRLEGNDVGVYVRSPDEYSD